MEQQTKRSSFVNVFALKKIINLAVISLVFALTACSGKPKVAMLGTDNSELRMKYHYVIYTPMRYMAHDPISALKNEKYYTKHNIYTNTLGTVSGDKVFYIHDKFIALDNKTKKPIFKKVVESYNKEARFTFGKHYVKIKGVQICNEDNECWSAGLEGSFKLVNKKPK